MLYSKKQNKQQQKNPTHARINLLGTSDKKVLSLMFSSLVILKELLQFLVVPANPSTQCLHTATSFAAPLLFTQDYCLCLLNPHTASKESSIGSSFVFISCTTPSTVVLYQVAGHVECDRDYCCYRWLLFSCELGWICLHEMNS